MNMMIGFFGSYLLGFDPSRMPPWGVALLVLEEVAVAVMVLVTTLLRKSVTVVVAMARCLCQADLSGV